MVCAEQKCRFRSSQYDTLHHLDEKPGYHIQNKRKEGCDEMLQLTFEECEEAKIVLDWSVTAISKISDARFPTGCYRQQLQSYRFRHDKRSYVWYFNNATTGIFDSKSESVCKGTDMYCRLRVSQYVVLLLNVCNDTGSDAEFCEQRKMYSYTGVSHDMNASSSDIIVLNPVTDSICNLKCAVGWYHPQYGNKAPFSCAPETKDRRSSEGVSTYPITCAGSRLCSRILLIVETQ